MSDVEFAQYLGQQLGHCMLRERTTMRRLAPGDVGDFDWVLPSFLLKKKPISNMNTKRSCPNMAKLLKCTMHCTVARKEIKKYAIDSMWFLHSVTQKVTLCAMVIDFVHKGLEKFYHSGSKAGIQAKHASKLQRILSNLDVACCSDDLDLPGYNLHELKGTRKGVWSITVQANWRITFRFVGEDIDLINYEDYH